MSRPASASQLEDLDELGADVLEQKRAVRFHKAQLHEAAEAKQLYIDQLTAIGIEVIEIDAQGVERKSQGRKK